MKVVDTKLNMSLMMSLGIEEEQYHTLSMDYFDRDGFELNQLEQALYRRNNINIDEGHLNHVANHCSWIVSDSDVDDPRLMIDHSCIQQRWEYHGEVREDLKIASHKRPSLNKLLVIGRKWGLDFNIDFVSEDKVLELFHIEIDRHDYQEFLEIKSVAEQFITHTDWVDVADVIWQKRHLWYNKNADEQILWKAQFLGWDMVYDTRKVF